MDDNPRRLLLKRQHPEYFTHLGTIATAALDKGIPLIVLLLKGFRPLFEPQPCYLKTCTDGRLLMPSPFVYENVKMTDMRTCCLYLNGLAAQLCQ